MTKVLNGGSVFAAVGLVTAAVACGVGGTTERVGTSSAAIQNGTVDSSHTFAVGVARRQGHAGYTCSGTLIAPNLVLTARHCVAAMNQTATNGVRCTTDTFGTTYAASDLSVTTSTTFADADKNKNWYGASKVLVPAGNAACGADVALIILSKSIPSSVAKPVDPAIDHFMTDHKVYSIDYVAIGYGITAPDTDTSGTRHILEGRKLTCLRGSSVVDCWKYVPGPNADAIVEAEFRGSDGVCSGDSGGGAYEQLSFAAGTPKVVGVAARAGADNGSCVGSTYERVDLQRDFLISGAQQAASLGGYSVPTWTLSAPPSDAGAPTTVKDASTTPPSSDAGPEPVAPEKLDIGAPCEANDVCASNMCAAETAESPFVCTTPCEASDTCPSGFSCRVGICLAGEAPATETVTTTTSSGCNTADPSKPVPWRGTAALVAGLALFAARRKRQQDCR